MRMDKTSAVFKVTKRMKRFRNSTAVVNLALTLLNSEALVYEEGKDDLKHKLKINQCRPSCNIEAIFN